MVLKEGLSCWSKRITQRLSRTGNTKDLYYINGPTPNTAKSDSTNCLTYRLQCLRTLRFSFLSSKPRVNIHGTIEFEGEKRHTITLGTLTKREKLTKLILYRKKSKSGVQTMERRRENVERTNDVGRQPSKTSGHPNMLGHFSAHGIRNSISNTARLQYYSRHPKIVSSSKIVGYYSVDKDRNYLANSSNLKYFNPPKDGPVSLDLNQGFNEVVRIEKTKNSKERILQWIEDNREQMKASPGTDRLIEPMFVCGGGVLLDFMRLAYIPMASWKIFVGKWKGTIYLRPESTAPPDYENELKFWYFGRKFQQYVTSESPNGTPGATKPGAESEEFRCVYQHQVANFSVLFSTGSDGVVSTEKLSDPLPLDKIKCIKTRTHRVIAHPKQDTVLKKFKFLNWWIHAYLINAYKLCTGAWDPNGIVRELKTYEIDDIPMISEQHWNPETCIKSCETIFSKLAETVVDDCDKTIYKISKETNEDVQITKLEPSEENCVVPEWYTTSMSQ